MKPGKGQGVNKDRTVFCMADTAGEFVCEARIELVKTPEGTFRPSYRALHRFTELWFEVDREVYLALIATANVAALRDLEHQLSPDLSETFGAELVAAFRREPRT